MMRDCIFCKIINKETPAEIIYEDEKVIAFKDIHPLAPIHYLVVPKKHIPTIEHLSEEDRDILWYLLKAICYIGKKENISTEGERGYKLVCNVGKGGGQVIEHVHFHLLGGGKSTQERDVPGMP